MSAFREWMLCLIASALALSLLRALMPKGAAGKVGGLAIGLVLVLLILKPLAAISPDWLLDSFRTQFEAASAYPEDLAVTNESYLESVMSQRCEEYIVSQGEALGVTVEARVECVWQSGYPVPDKVTLWGMRSQELERMITEELGVAQESIVVEEVKE